MEREFHLLCDLCGSLMRTNFSNEEAEDNSPPPNQIGRSLHIQQSKNRMKIDRLISHSELNQIRFKQEKKNEIGLSTSLECSKYFGFWIDRCVFASMLEHNKNNNGKPE